MARLHEVKGILPALVTPFKKDESIDEQALRDLVNFVIEKGVHGVVPVGTTGEFMYMKPEEREKVFKIVVDEVNGRVPVIAGCGASGTDIALDLVKRAEDIGADAALVVSPFYIAPWDKGVFEHFRRICSSTDLPIVVYNIPQCTGYFISGKVIEDLAEFENVIALKDSSGSIAYILEVIERTEGKLNVLVGHDEIVMAALIAGASGAILASANVIPEVWCQLYDAVQRGDITKARKLQLGAQKVARIITRYGGPVAVKAALGMRGIKVGKTRRPLVSGGVLSWEDREELRLELEKLGVLKPSYGRVEEFPKEEFSDIGLTPEVIGKHGMRVAKCSAGSGTEEVILSAVVGTLESPISEAFALALSLPREGYEALTAILEPNLMVRPATLIVPAVKVENMRQASMIYGPVQAAVAKAVADSLEEGTIPKEFAETGLMIVKVRIHPNALNRKMIYGNTYEAMRTIIKEIWGG